MVTIVSLIQMSCLHACTRISAGVVLHEVSTHVLAALLTLALYVQNWPKKYVHLMSVAAYGK